MCVDTIAAIATPPGAGGIGVVKISGPKATTLVLPLLRPSRGLSRLRPRHLYHGYIVDLEGDHGHPIDAEAPRQDRNGDAQRNGHLGPEDPRPAELDPAEAWMLHVSLDRRLCEGEVARDEFNLLGLSHFNREELQEPQESLEIDILTQHDSFDLEEVARVRGINRIGPKAPGKGEVLARDIRLRSDFSRRAR